MTSSPRGGVSWLHPSPRLFVLIGLAAALASALLVGGARSASQASGLIAFTREDGVYVIRPDGSGARLLWRGAHPKDVSWAPDGSKLAVSSAGRSIWVVNADGGNPVRIARVGASSLSWSPDGRRIAFTRWYRAGDYDVWVMDADGSDMRRLKRTPDLWERNVDWSPVGARIAFDGGGWFPQIHVMRTDGTQLRKLTTAESWEEWSEQPEWSPDGRRIAFTKDGNKVYVMNASGKGLRQLTRSGSVEHSPTWSPDGRKIAFVRGRVGAPIGIYVMNADGKSVTRLTRNLGDGSPAWQPLGAP